jgi:hypothetical protein
MKITFQLMHHYNYSYNDIMNWIPWEREVYLSQLQRWIQEEQRIHAQKKR